LNREDAKNAKPVRTQTDLDANLRYFFVSVEVGVVVEVLPNGDFWFF